VSVLCRADEAMSSTPRRSIPLGIRWSPSPADGETSILHARPAQAILPRCGRAQRGRPQVRLVYRVPENSSHLSSPPSSTCLRQRRRQWELPIAAPICHRSRWHSPLRLPRMRTTPSGPIHWKSCRSCNNRFGTNFSGGLFHCADSRLPNCAPPYSQTNCQSQQSVCTPGIVPPA